MTGDPAPEHRARYEWAQQLVAGQRVLDAACGTGEGTRMLAAYATEAVGVDVSPASLADATRDHGDEATFLEADVRELPFAADEFDVVICFEALAQIPDTERVLDELRRVLSPDGLLVVSSPNRGVYPSGNPLHARELTSDELSVALTSRFANVAIHGQQSYHASLLSTRTTLGEPGTELYAIAVATDADLPPDPNHLVLGRQLDYDEQRQLVAELRERCVQAEAEVVALRNQVDILRRQLDTDG